MVMIVVVVVVVVVIVMRAAFRCLRELSGQKRGGRGVNRTIRLGGPNSDALLGEQFECAAANAAREHHLHALLAQPAWKETGLMRWGGDDLFGGDDTGLAVGVHEGEFFGAAEMAVEPVGGSGDGNA
jgi:hypothetical protein